MSDISEFSHFRLDLTKGCVEVVETLQIKDPGGGTETVWQRQSRLGKGSYGEVYLYQDINDSTSLRAVKSMKTMEVGGRTTSDQLAKEVRALKKFSGQKVGPDTHVFSADPANYWSSTERCSFNSLDSSNARESHTSS
jgi:serine/threonine protein kinase